MPLFDKNGTSPWPEMTARLDALPRRGTLIVTRDQLAPPRRKVHLSWQPDYFRHQVAEIHEAAEIDDEVEFMGLRHGGNVEGALAPLKAAPLRID